MQWNDLRDPIVEDSDLIKAVDSVGKEAVQHGPLTKVVSFLVQNTNQAGRTEAAVAGHQITIKTKLSITSQKAPNGFSAPK